MIAIGLIGANGSGKSSVCTYLHEKGYVVFSLSDIVRDEARQNGLALDRDNLVSTANALKKQEGQDVLARRVMSTVELSIAEDVVFDSIRNVAETEFLKSRGVRLLGLEVSLQSRYDRIKTRQGDTDQVDFVTFSRQDEREASGSSFGQHINACLPYCDTIISNDGTLDDLYAKVDQFLLED
ncbi:AAA family ATPase [bacterium]|jgi:dephospho-CoA kinase|nr:AAA family ATPase [bacterium]